MTERLEKILGDRLAAHADDRCYWWDGEWHTCGDLLALADGCEKALKEAGFKRGQRLVVMMKNCPMIAALSIAVWRLGGAFCPLNVAMGLIPLIATLELIDPFAVVVSPDVKDTLIDGLKDKGWSFVTAQPNEPLPSFTGKVVSDDSDNWAVIFATSGTTGNPKAVPLTHANIFDNCLGLHESLPQITSEDVVLTVLPNFHSFGYTVANIYPLTIGAKLTIVPGFLPPQAAMKAMDETGVTLTFAVPAIYAYMLASVERGSLRPEALSRQKLLISGGDRLNPNLHEQAQKLCGCDILEGYGLTETSPVIALNRNIETHLTGTVGPFMPRWEYKLRTRDGKDTDDNEGVLWVRGPSVTPGYFRAPEISAERFDGEWLNTGDYVKIEKGPFTEKTGVPYIRILDRVTDIIIVGGFNVYPQEVEKILSQHPAVQTAIVVGVPHDINGEIPKAFIQKVEGADVTDRDIIKFAKTHLAHFKVPRSVEFVDEFPLSGTGKILRRVLREQSGKKGI